MPNLSIFLLTAPVLFTNSIPFVTLVVENFFERSSSQKNIVLTCLSESGIDSVITADHYDISLADIIYSDDIAYSRGSPEFYRAPNGKLLVLRPSLADKRYGIYRCRGSYAAVELGSGSDSDYQLLPEQEFYSTTSIFIANQDSPVQRADFIDLSTILSSDLNNTATKSVTIPFLSDSSMNRNATWRLISENFTSISTDSLILTKESSAGWYLANFGDFEL